MLTDFGLAHPSINPTRPKQIKSMPDKSDSSSTEKNCDLNVSRFLIVLLYNFKTYNFIFRLNDQVQ